MYLSSPGSSSTRGTSVVVIFSVVASMLIAGVKLDGRALFILRVEVIMSQKRGSEVAEDTGIDGEDDAAVQKCIPALSQLSGRARLPARVVCLVQEGQLISHVSIAALAVLPCSVLAAKYL